MMKKVGQVGFLFLSLLIVFSACHRRMPPQEIAKLLTAKSILKGHEAPVFAVAYNENKNLIASADTKGALILWNAKTGEKITTLTFHNIPFYSLAFSPDGNFLACAGKSQTVVIYELENFKVYKSFTAHNHWIFDIVWNGKNELITCSCQSLDFRHLCNQGEVAFWKLNQKVEEIKRFSAHSDWINALDLSPQSRWLATAGADRAISLWDMNSLRLVKSFVAHNHKVSEISFLGEDFRKLVSASFDGSVRLWKLPEGKLIRELGRDLGEIYALCVSKDGKLIFAGGREKILYIWSGDSGRLLRKIAGLGGYISSLATNSFGSTVIAGLYDNTVIIFKAEKK